MIGLANISANSGWSQALLGAGLVFSGLVLLSLAIAQVHKLVAFFEARQARKTVPTGTVAAAPPAGAGYDHCPSDIQAVARDYHPLVSQLPAPFQIARLYALALQAGFPHPYLSVKCLREAGVLTPHGDGLFSWNAGTPLPTV
jgi:hypothetical protein